ncbi:type IV conjugative transfer system protein TraL [Vibrio brasiliensis]|uniref:type IV conjugative transfer system protein TraL n=1 Tax=Vibrio brasiliensis TaxID=170652 RepID=UPI001EFCF221|nr:type IV conjugative transfer system protein TraL [Vibrio brasiliensis]MCG9727481.1 type IV conjugative transfer system protein TraL [Vibrio brasiliensis]MCG9784527.1 type IV conjugative transfer system protein TraL [Vibrio brasiliensis]
MDNKRLFYSIPKHINKGKRISGLPRDEVFPSTFVFVCFFIMGKYLIGFILAAVWFTGLRYIKVQYGDNIIALTLYWWGSASLSQYIFRHTPPAQCRYWLA